MDFYFSTPSPGWTSIRGGLLLEGGLLFFNPKFFDQLLTEFVNFGLEVKFFENFHAQKLCYFTRKYCNLALNHLHCAIFCAVDTLDNFRMSS
jgi:hypothetical protein